jgi:uncharacterized membrane protein YfcA
VAALVAFSAGIFSGVTGFGLAVIVVPLLLLVYDPKTVVALTGVLSLTVAAAAVRALTPPTPCLCSLAPSVTTPLYNTTVS